MVPFVDTHCHLDLIKGIDRNPGLEDALPIKSISVTNAPFLFGPNKKLFFNAKNIKIAIGMHPELIPQYFNQMDIFEENVASTKYVGEIGLDGSESYRSYFALQNSIFEKILSIAAKANDKILTVHSRNAAGETIEKLYMGLKNTNCKVILHWYSGSLVDMKLAIKYGYYFSINHKMVATAKAQSLISSIPESKLLSETDAPFTFDNKVTTRLQSLQITTNGLSSILKKSALETQELIMNNFKSLLS